MNAVCRACGNDYVRGPDHVGYECERCLHNARHQAERTLENRRGKPQSKRKAPTADEYEVNR